MKHVVAATVPVIVVVPAPTIVTAPELSTVATEVLLLVKVGVASELVVKALLTEPPQVVVLELLAKLAVAATGVQAVQVVM